MPVPAHQPHPRRPQQAAALRPGHLLQRGARPAVGGRAQRHLVDEDDDADELFAVEKLFGNVFCYVAERDNERCVAAFLESNSASVRHRNDDGWSPIFFAAANGNAEMLEKLITAGAP